RCPGVAGAGREPPAWRVRAGRVRLPAERRAGAGGRARARPAARGTAAQGCGPARRRDHRSIAQCALRARARNETGTRMTSSTGAMREMQSITLLRPDDWHLHVRDGEALAAVVPHTAERFGRAIIMPNLRPPVTTTAQALAYRERILAAVPDGVSFEPLMTLYLTDNMAPEEIDRAADSGAIVALKLYPAGATTNSDSGVTDIANTYAVLERMQARGLLLCVHG